MLVRYLCAPILTAAFLATVVTPAAAAPATCFEWEGLTFLEIPGGSFTMGANKLSSEEAGSPADSPDFKKRRNGGFKDEFPTHKVTLSPFCMLRDSISGDAINALHEKIPFEYDFREPEALTWAQARALGEALSKASGKKIRLPTEAEWEYAARGGLAGKHFPWGNANEKYDGTPVRDIMLLARRRCRVFSVRGMVRDTELKGCLESAKSDWARLNEMECYMSVLGKRIVETPPNGYGLVNLVNNEWEWTSSKYMPYPYSAKYGREDPTSKLRQDFRVVRGGNNNSESCLGYTALRGYGGNSEDWTSRFRVRFVMER